MNRKILVGLFIAALAMVGLLGVSGVSAHSAVVLSHFGAATLDGQISPGEYSCVGPVTQSGLTFRVCETNDESFDYYAIEINDLTRNPISGSSPSDSFNILFDDEHDGFIDGVPCTAARGEDSLEFGGAGVGFTSNYLDIFYCAVVGGFGDGAGFQHFGPNPPIFTFTPGVGYVHEIAHPLSSGDPRDYSLSLGSVVGWCLIYNDVAISGVEIEFPVGCFNGVLFGDASSYGNIFKAAPPVVGGEIPSASHFIGLLMAGSLIGVATAASVITFAILRRKRSPEN